MVELRITKTAKFAPRCPFQIYDSAHKSFDDKAAADVWLRQEYGKSKRVPMYRDCKDGATKRVGHVISFRVKYRMPGEPYIEQHWVEFRSCEDMNLSRRAS